MFINTNIHDLGTNISPYKCLPLERLELVTIRSAGRFTTAVNVLILESRCPGIILLVSFNVTMTMTCYTFES